MKKMRILSTILVLSLFLGQAAAAEERLKMSTTTSTDAPTTATDRASSIGSRPGLTRADAGTTADRLPGTYFFAMALSFTAALYACQPGMPLTPPPPWVAHDPW